MEETKNPIRKIDIEKVKVCRDQQHNPPTMRVYEPGTYEHTCPSCGNVIIFIVPEITS